MMTSTMMACPETVMNNEQLYFRLLPTVNAYSLNVGKLDLIYAGGHNAMTFIPGPGKGSQGGQGTGQSGTSGLPTEALQREWILQYFNSNSKAGQDVSGAGISSKFDAAGNLAAGTLSGFAGCNTYNGAYKVSGQQLT